MTAMKSAFEKAGVDTVRTELVALASKLLKDSEPERVLAKFVRELKARPPLLNYVALEYLKTLAADDERTGAGEGHPTRDDLGTAATPAPGPIKVKAHQVRAHRRRTAEQRAAERTAWLMSAQAINETWRVKDQPIGDIHWGQLNGLLAELAHDCSRGLMHNLNDAVNCIGLKKIKDHASVDDQDKRIRDVIAPELLNQILVEARAEAPLLIERCMKIVADNLDPHMITEIEQHAQQ